MTHYGPCLYKGQWYDTLRTMFIQGSVIWRTTDHVYTRVSDMTHYGPCLYKGQWYDALRTMFIQGSVIWRTTDHVYTRVSDMTHYGPCLYKGQWYDALRSTFTQGRGRKKPKLPLVRRISDMLKTTCPHTCSLVQVLVRFVGPKLDALDRQNSKHESHRLFKFLIWSVWIADSYMVKKNVDYWA